MTSLVSDYKGLISKLTNGPVILSEQNRPAAVLLSVSEYERMSSRLDHLELLREAKRHLAKAELHPDSTISHNDLKQLMRKQGVKEATGHVGD